MAQDKYDLYTVATSSKKRFPWYRERLELKYLQPRKCSATLNSDRWTFLAPNLDAMRSGVSTTQVPDSNVVIKRTPDLVPLIDARRSSCSHVRARCHPQLDSLGASTYNSRVGPQYQERQTRVSEVEKSLLKHPLGLYPHLEEAIPPEVLEEVVCVLDPELNPADSCSESTPIPLCTSVDLPKRVTSSYSARSSSPPVSVTDSLYRWPLTQTDEERLTEKSLLASQKVISPDQESRVNKVTCDLVQWAKDLSSPAISDSLDESTIQSLFTSDYESQPVLVAPIHVVELMDVPAELRLESREKAMHPAGIRRKGSLTLLPRQNEGARVVHTRYGAWYLPINLWRRRRLDEPLLDPHREATKAESEATVRSRRIDQMLTDLHGARAFRQFITTSKPGATIPEEPIKCTFTALNGLLVRLIASVVRERAWEASNGQ